MTGTATKTRYASNQDRNICMLLDVRGNARDRTLEVFSESRAGVVSIPRYVYGTTRPQITIHTPENKRWYAVTVPAWYRKSYGLYGYSNLPQIVPAFCREAAPDHRTLQEKIDDGERALAQYIVDRENKYRRLPGQQWETSSRRTAAESWRNA
jgi:hypothetical protein